MQGHVTPMENLHRVYGVFSKLEVVPYDEISMRYNLRWDKSGGGLVYSVCHVLFLAKCHVQYRRRLTYQAYGQRIMYHRRCFPVASYQAGAAATQVRSVIAWA